MESYQFQDHFNWFIPTSGAGDHDLKMGFQFNTSRHQRVDQTAMNGVFQLASDLDFDASNPFTYPERLTVRLPGPDTPKSGVNSTGLFVQDKVQIDNMTLSLGVRYDVHIATVNTGEFNPLFDNPDFRPVDKNNIAPRTSFAYDIDGRSVIRAGYGRFYERLWVDRFENAVRRTVFANSFEADFPLDDTDPGPSLGQFPTHALLVNGPVLDRGLLDQLVPPGTTSRNLGSVWLDNPDRTMPYQDSFNVGYERELAPTVSVGVDYIHMEGGDLPLRYNLNQPVRAGTDRTDPVTRVDFMDIAGQLGLSPFASNVYMVENIASSKFDGLNMQVEKRFSNNWGARASYSIGKARTQNDGDANDELNVFQVGDERNLDQLWGNSFYDRRHILTRSGRVELPRTGGVTLSAVARYQSGRPFTIHDSTFDPNQNGIAVDPLSAGTYSGVGANAITVDNAGGLRGAYGVDYVQLDMRAGYRLRWGAADAGRLWRDLQPDQPYELRQPDGRQAVGELSRPDHARGGRLSPAVPGRSQVRLLKGGIVTLAILRPVEPQYVDVR